MQAQPQHHEIMVNHTAVVTHPRHTHSIPVGNTQNADYHTDTHTRTLTHTFGCPVHCHLRCTRQPNSLQSLKWKAVAINSLHVPSFTSPHTKANTNPPMFLIICNIHENVHIRYWVMAIFLFLHPPINHQVTFLYMKNLLVGSLCVWPITQTSWWKKRQKCKVSSLYAICT